MLLYAFLMALVPPAIWLIRRGLWWIVLPASLALWSGYQLWPERLTLPWRIVDYQDFPLAAWQVLFFTGLLLGYHGESVGRMRKRIPRPPLAGGWLLPTSTAFAALVWLHVTNASVLDHWAGAGAGARLLDAWFDKTSLPLPRLAACVVVFGFAWQLVTIAWEPLRRLVGPFLLPLGGSALYAYSAHVVAACVIEILLFQVQAGGRLGVGESFAVQSAMLTAVWTATRFHLFQPQVRWLGRPPLGAFERGWRPAPSMFAAGILLGAAGLGTLSQDAGTSVSFASGSAESRREAYNNPVTTVTPPRASLQVTSSPVDTGRAALQQASADSGEIDPEFAVVAGSLSESTIESGALGQTMPFAIYLPPSYASGPVRRFPVLYLLHGAGGRYTEWSVYGLPQKAAEMMADGTLTEFIVVMPEGGRGYWANGLSGDGEAWADYVIDDLVPFIDSTYRTIPQAPERAIGGLSRGGFGALYLAFTHPDVFGIVGANSPSLPGDSTGVEAVRVSAEELPSFDPVEIARHMDVTSAPKIWIDVGNEDDWQPAVKLLDSVLTGRGVPHEFSVGDGGHLQEYWIARTPEYLDFYGRAFEDGFLLEP